MMKNFIKNHVGYWFPVYAWMGLVFYFSLTPLISSGVISLGSTVTPLDYYKHALSYGFLTFLLWRAFQKSKLKHSEFFAFTAAFVYGVFIELNQYFVPNRYPSVFDVFANFIGCVAVLPFILVYKKFSKRKKG